MIFQSCALEQAASGFPDCRGRGRALAIVADVLGQIHRGPAALAKFTLNRVAAFEGCAQAGDGIVGHGPNMGRELSRCHEFP